MLQFFIKSSNITRNKCIINGEDYYHLRSVRRVKPGDFIDLRSNQGILYKGRLIEIDAKSIVAEIVEIGEKIELPIKLTLYASMLKGKSFDLVLQKATEIGISRIIPVITERTIPIISGKEKKRRR